MKNVPCLWLVMGALAAGCGKNDPPSPAAAPVSPAPAAPASMPSLQAGAAAAAPPGQGAVAAASATPAPPAVDFTAARPVNEKGDPMSDLDLLNQALFHCNEARATGATGGGQLRTYKTEAEQMAAEAAQQKSLGPVTDLSELVKAGIIRAIPPAPAGKKYAIDPKTHKAVLVNGP